jgi:hypothetical protein
MPKLMLRTSNKKFLTLVFSSLSYNASHRKKHFLNPNGGYMPVTPKNAVIATIKGQYPKGTVLKSTTCDKTYTVGKKGKPAGWLLRGEYAVETKA